MFEEYTAEDLLPLSGLQHFVFCRRQWALIHLESQWKENYLTASGRQLHERVDDPFFNQRRADLIIARSVPIVSYKLGLTGICDLVEFKSCKNGVSLPGHTGCYSVTPVEYKRGEPKTGMEDLVQVAAQALCLEEMLSTQISNAFLFYGKTRHRFEVIIDAELRNKVLEISSEMHALYKRQHTPQVRTSKACKSCSLAELCLPELQGKRSALGYIHAALAEDDN